MAGIELLAVISGAGVAAVALASGAAVKCWNEWLQFKRLEVEQRTCPSRAPSELKTLRERVRRLEAIADGVE
jgi:hypothetical protein